MRETTKGVAVHGACHARGLASSRVSGVNRLTRAQGTAGSACYLEMHIRQFLKR